MRGAFVVPTHRTPPTRQSHIVEKYPHQTPESLHVPASERMAPAIIATSALPFHVPACERMAAGVRAAARRPSVTHLPQLRRGGCVTSSAPRGDRRREGALSRYPNVTYQTLVRREM